MKRHALPDREARLDARVERMRAQLAVRQAPAPAPVPRAVAPGTGMVDAALAGLHVPEVAPAPKATAAEKRHMDRVAALRCVLCDRLGMFQQAGKTDVHHLRQGQGMAQRASNWLVAALCHERCHQGTRGVHGDRSLLKQAKATELDLLAWTLEALAREDACAKRSSL